MSREWKPGDVALVTYDNASQNMRALGQTDIQTTIGLRREDDWGLPSFGCSIESDDARPLVVIDPEDREQVERLWRIWTNLAPDHRLAQDNMQAALREFANPTPPKPEEPTGLGAVVRDSGGLQWVRATFADADHYGWRCANRPQDNGLYRWPEVDAIEVIREGWSE